MSPHKCTGQDYPPGGITCFCCRGEDHDESLFGVPVSGNPEPAPETESDLQYPAHITVRMERVEACSACFSREPGHVEDVLLTNKCDRVARG